MAAIGFIGSGNIGGTVARLSVAAGCDVVLSNSRGPQTLTNLVQELGPRARAASSRGRDSGRPSLPAHRNHRRSRPTPAA
jgi:predicted dinucleotide-binding enzyme